MKEFDEELKRRAAALPELSFPPELAQRILAVASQTSPQRHRRWRTSGIAASITGVAAAALMVAAVWNFGSHEATPIRSPMMSDSTAAQPVFNGDYGLMAAPVSVEYIGITSAKAGAPRNTVSATLTNVGTTVLQPSDLVGVLSFQKGTGGEILPSTDWITFVDAPKTPLQPGQTVTWSFQPLGAPTDGHGNLTEVPRLVFFQSGLVDATKADTAWTAPAVSVTDVSAHVRSRWSTGQSFEVDAVIRNPGQTTVSLHNLLAVVWFSTAASQDWSQSGTLRFMARVEPAAGGTTMLPPGTSVKVAFRLIGPVDADIIRSTPHVNLIQR